MTALLALAVALAVTPIIRLGMRRWNVIDVPNARSSHTDPTPRGGGVGVALAVILAVLLAPGLGTTTKAGVLVASLALGAVGLVEDLVGIPALRRLPLQALAAAAALPWLLRLGDGFGAWPLVVGAAVVLWVVSYANAFNFMDGINGIAAAQAIVAGLTWFVLGRVEDVPWLATVGLVVAAAALGFAPHNLRRARVFLGDVGSYFLGGVLACVAVLALRAGLPPEAVLAPLAVYLADTGSTLLRRILRGDRWYEAHREHAYQRLTASFGDSHVRTTLFVSAVMLTCSAVGLLGLAGSTPLRILGGLAIFAVLAGYLRAPSLAPVRVEGRLVAWDVRNSRRPLPEGAEGARRLS